MDAGVRPHKGLGLVWVVTGLFSGVGCPKRAPPSEPCARTVAREFEARPTTRVSLKQELQVLETRCHERPPAPLGSLADFDEELGPIGMAPTAPTMGTAELRALAERGCSSGANDARESCWLEDDELAALATEG